MKSPIFIFSLPRSGSTLLQRLLQLHKSIGSINEPWIQLPLFYILKEEGQISEFSKTLSHKAISNVFQNIPNGEKFFQELIRNLSIQVYEKLLGPEEIYFLDKTPRYYYIIDELYETYPDAKFIFLFRNPVHIYSSILTTWCGNNFFKLYGSHNDLNIGFNKLSQSYLKHKNKTNTMAINYEKLIENPSLTLDQIQDFLELEIDHSLVSRLHNSKIQTVNGELLGDPTGIRNYRSISPDTLHKWRQVFNTRIRKKIISNYVKKLDENLIAQGYSSKQILGEIKELNNKGRFFFLTDLICYLSYRILVYFNLYVYFSKSLKWTKNKFLS